MGEQIYGWVLYSTGGYVGGALVWEVRKCHWVGTLLCIIAWHCRSPGGVWRALAGYMIIQVGNDRT